MPCSSEGYGPLDINIEPLLCGILTQLEKDGTLTSVIARVDWREAGYSARTLREWWHAHKERDIKRREDERQRIEREARRKEVMSKLSPEERRLLGIDV